LQPRRASSRAELVDELLVYLAPLLIGEAQGMVHLPALSDLAQARRLALHEVTQVGEDVRLLARLQPLADRAVA
jgi:diaminohydroxyphosphoribosylaminopyrimidine deaminase / 5-amino-6-(5-phosphoribosylamino)uracil reductase